MKDGPPSTFQPFNSFARGLPKIFSNHWKTFAAPGRARLRPGRLHPVRPRPRRGAALPVLRPPPASQSPLARQDAAPPEAKRRPCRKFRVPSGGAAASRALSGAWDVQGMPHARHGPVAFLSSPLCPARTEPGPPGLRPHFSLICSRTVQEIMQPKAGRAGSPCPPREEWMHGCAIRPTAARGLAALPICGHGNPACQRR